MPGGRTAFAPLAPAPIHVEGFEGPFELLLHLLDRRQLEITAVSLAAVASQYLSYVQLLPPAAFRLDCLAEFMVVGANLLVLKSRALLPREVACPREAIELDEDSLAARLAEYRRFRAAAEQLRERHDRGQRAFARRVPPPLPPAPPRRLVSAEPLHLARVLERLLARRQEPAPAAPARPRVSLADRIDEILAAVRARRRVSFAWLAEGCQTRTDLVITFLAILELYRTQAVALEQDALFGEIWIAVRQPPGPWQSRASDPERPALGGERLRDVPSS